MSEVFLAFLKLGLTSFGGPIAHLAYFRRELVERRRWIGEADFARLLALCQFLPGPASSQLGFSLGLLRAGWGGAIAAFVAFTLPSAILLFAFARIFPQLSGAWGQAAIHGLKLVAVAVVSQGVLGMARQLCPDAPRATIAALSAAVLLVSGAPWMQILVVALGALAGLALLRDAPAVAATGLEAPYGMRTGTVLLAIFAVLLFGLPLLAQMHPGLPSVVEGFYRAGALVFGGGHVVLPLLRETVVAPGWVAPDDFLAGYGAAQAVPGPMFTLSAYLGARLPGAQGGVLGSSVALLSIFLPGFLLVAGALPFWRSIGATPRAVRAVAGVNAAVVGLLAAALYDPVWKSAIDSPIDVAIAIIGFMLLVAWRASALVVVLWCVVAALLGMPLVAAAHGAEGHHASHDPAQHVEQTPFGRAGDPREVSRTIAIGMSDAMRYEPSEIRVKQGETVKLVVANHGHVLHEIVIGTMGDLKKHAELMRKFPDMEHDEPNMAHVKPGRQEELVWQFNKPGEFHFACLIPGHFEAGMVGRIVVAGSPAKSARPDSPAVAPANNALTQGQVMKVDREAGKITLRHGRIANLDMPAMTMVFRAKDRTLLDHVKVGDTVEFQAERVDGALTVTQLRTKS